MPWYDRLEDSSKSPATEEELQGVAALGVDESWLAFFRALGQTDNFRVACAGPAWLHIHHAAVIVNSADKAYHRRLRAMGVLEIGASGGGDPLVLDLTEGGIRWVNHNRILEAEDLFEDELYDDLMDGKLDPALVYVDPDSGEPPYREDSPYLQRHLREEATMYHWADVDAMMADLFG